MTGVVDRLNAALRYMAPKDRAEIRRAIAALDAADAAEPEATPVPADDVPPQWARDLTEQIAQALAAHRAEITAMFDAISRLAVSMTPPPALPALPPSSSSPVLVTEAKPAAVARTLPLPHKHGQLPAPKLPPPAAARRDASRPSDDALIAQHIAQKGVTRGKAAFVAPSQHAALDGAAAREKLAGMTLVMDGGGPREVELYLKSQGRDAWTNGKDFKLAGKIISRKEFYDAANRLRSMAGLPIYRAPAEKDEKAA